MLRSLTTTERDAFLAAPVTGVLVLRRRDGSPMLSPVWHEWEGGAFHFVVGLGDVKWRAVERESAVAFAVFGQHPPYPAVEVHGRAAGVETGAQARERMWRIATRYVGPDRAKRFMESIPPDGLGTIQLTIETMRTFDQSEVPGLGPG